jgi:hypothetical protein
MERKGCEHSSPLGHNNMSEHVEECIHAGEKSELVSVLMT